MPSSVLVRVVFGLLVLATVGAFFVTQRLKREEAVVKGLELQVWLSPNGDGRKDTARLGFRLPDADEVTVSMVDEKGDEVARIADGRRLRKGMHRFTWDGRDDAGAVVDDGSYRLRVTLREEGRSVTFPRALRVDSTPPVPVLARTAPSVVPAGRSTPVRLRYRGPSSVAGEFRVYRTDDGPPREVGGFGGARGSAEGRWPVMLRDRRAPEGIYAFAVIAQDRALNAGSGPPELPPTAESARPGTGVTVTGLRVSGPLEPVRAGGLVRMRVGPGERRFRWRLARIGGGRAVRTGRGNGASLDFRLPDDVRTGLHVVSVSAAGRRARFPLAIRGRPPAGGRTRGGDMLVVLPALTWQGLNPVDDDADGFADTLDSSKSVLLDRPLAGGRVPVGFAREVAPMMRFLDENRLGYELTTDLALARNRGPRIEDHTGALFPGSERWLPDELNVRLREYVEGGGKVASFGIDAFRRRARLAGNRLTEPSAPEGVNVFGERLGEAGTAELAPLQVFEDRVGVFRGSDGFVGLFERFEPSGGLVEGARRVTAAGREAERPAFVAYRLREGLVIRAGTPGWGEVLAAAAPSSEVEAATERVWTLLSR